MKIIFLTQDDPFYLPTIYSYLIPKLKNNGIEIISTILFDVSPFGVKKSKTSQLIDTYKTFGLKFTLHYSIIYLKKIFEKNVKKVMSDYEINTIKLDSNINSPKSINLIKSYNADLLVSIAGNQIFKTKLINSAKFGIINLHSALLPKYRGLMPSFWVLKNNEKETGVSVFFVDEGIDSGRIITQKKVDIENKSQKDLIWELKFLGADCIVESCLKIKKYGFKTKTFDNNDNEMTYFSRPKRSDVIEFLKLNKKFF
tara:strand:- start:336 stop:1103 length:768 start_codon:yes stop_codon:yes gene_type:complete